MLKFSHNSWSQIPFWAPAFGLRLCKFLFQILYPLQRIKLKILGVFRGFLVCQLLFSSHKTPISGPCLPRQFPCEHFPVCSVLCSLYLNYFTFQHWMSDFLPLAWEDFGSAEEWKKEQGELWWLLCSAGRQTEIFLLYIQ